MASSGDLHEDISPRLLPPLVKASDRQPQKKDFDIRLSRMSLTNSDAKESMLAYSQHVRQISHARKLRPTHVPQLALRAHHVPKNTTSMTSRHRRKSMSLNELIERRKNPNTDRRHNVSLARSLPSLKVAHLPPKHLRISFVSASDLHDILDCNFKSKGTRSDSLRLSLWESGTSLSWMSEKDKADPPTRNTRDSRDSLITKVPQSDSVQQSPEKKLKSDFPLFKQDPINPSATTSDLAYGKLSTSLPALVPLQPIHSHQQSHANNPAKPSSLETGNRVGRLLVSRHRPRRAKRMTLHRPELGVIPESEGDGDAGARNKSHFPSRSSLDAIKSNRTNCDKGMNISFEECNLESLIGAPSLNKSGSESSTQMPLSGLSTIIPSKSQFISGTVDSGLEEKQMSQPGEYVMINDPEDNPGKETIDDVGSSKKNKSKASKKMNKFIFLRDFPDKHYLRK